MSEPNDSKDPISEEIEAKAAQWMWRLDRGLAPEEQDSFFEWLHEDPSHKRAFAKHRSNWKRLDQLSAWRPEHGVKPNPDLLAPSRSSWHRYLFTGALAAAAAILVVVSIFSLQRDVQQGPVVEEIIAESEGNRRALDDGSEIQMNENTKLDVLFTSAERRVRLERGEAFFTVAKDASRPFVVEVHGIDVSAIGTAFNVRMDERAETFEVLVAEGRVKVDAAPELVVDGERREQASQPSLLAARQRAIVSVGKAPQPAQIAALSDSEVRRVLSWQRGVVTFEDRSLGAIVAEFNRLNATQIALEDDALATMLISGTFRSDNVAAFARLVEIGFGAEIASQSDELIVLRKRPE